MGNIVTDFHVDRIKQLIDGAKGLVACGGKVNKAAKYVEPTVIINPDPKSPVMKEEIFGPVIPVITFKDISEVINHINDETMVINLWLFTITENLFRIPIMTDYSMRLHLDHTS
jgi:aldehyde dehydrogenase (NAD+)